MYRRLFALALVCLFALLTNVANYFFFGWIDGLIAKGDANAVVLRLDVPTLVRVFLPMGAIVVTVPNLLIEMLGLGWQQSSLRRLLFDESNSTYTDLFYFAITISGIKPLLAFLMSLGAGYWFNAVIARHFAIHLLTNASFIVSLSVLFLVNTLIFYWVHRIMHTPLFWEIHKIHHSAEHMNIITPHRNHPIDMVVVTVMGALPAAVLGASPTVILVYTILYGFHQQLSHSDWDWNLPRLGLGFVESHLLFLSGGHRIHHSDIRKHWNKNFGILPLWDRLFGTFYQHAPDENVLIGLYGGGELTNTGRPIWEIWMIYRRWLQIAGELVGKTLGRTASGPAAATASSSVVKANAALADPQRAWQEAIMGPLSLADSGRPESAEPAIEDRPVSV